MVEHPVNKNITATSTAIGATTSRQIGACPSLGPKAIGFSSHNECSALLSQVLGVPSKKMCARRLAMNGDAKRTKQTGLLENRRRTFQGFSEQREEVCRLEGFVEHAGDPLSGEAE